MTTLTPAVDHYAQEPGGFRLRGSVAAVVVLAHLGGIGYVMAPAPEPRTVGTETMEVVFIAPPQEEVLPPPPQPKIEQPPILAAQRTAEPVPEAPVIPPETVNEAPPDQPVKELAPPTPPAQPAAPAAPAVVGNTSGVQLIAMPNRPKLILPSGVKVAIVKVKVRVDVRGRVQKVELVASSGYDAVDMRGLRDARDARYKPAMKEGEPREDEAILPIKYEEPKK